MQRYDKFRLPPNFSGKKLHFYVIFSHFLTKHTKNSGLRCFFLDKGEDKGEYQRERLHNPTCRAGNWESVLYIKGVRKNGGPACRDAPFQRPESRCAVRRSRSKRYKQTTPPLRDNSCPHPTPRPPSPITDWLPSWRPETLRVSPMLRIPPFAHGAREPADTP